MKKLLALLFHPWLLLALGLLALAMLIWFIGPLVAIAEWRPLESVNARLIAIALPVVLVLLRGGWRAWKARSTQNKLMDSLLTRAPTAPATPGVAETEVATLTQRFEEAIQTLRQVRLNAAGTRPGLRDWLAVSNRQYLYQLPWYVFIGTSGSGKTTALVNSGLQFPLAEQFGTARIRGVGGTRNCDWWFTDEAVLLDTAGRYTTQESDREADRGAWEGFLALLKKFRPRRPINGILLTVSVADLLTESLEARERHAQSLRARIQELHQTFAIRFPIYVLLSKTDLLAGFTEFFDDLGKEQRGQVWGMTFPYRGIEDRTPPLAGFAEEYTALETRLRERLLDRLQQERDLSRRAAIFGFPQQFALLRAPLEDLLGRVFAVSKFDTAPLLRGIYLTSGTQEGSPIDRMMGGLARAFGLRPSTLATQSASGRSYFLTRLLRDVVFREQALAGLNLRVERRRRLIQWATYGMLGLFTLGAGVAWWSSYHKNQTYLASVEQRLASVRQQLASLPAATRGDSLALLPVLQSVQALGRATGTQDGATPTGMGFGLYQGDKLAGAADQAYQRLLRDAFLPRLVLRLEQLLRSSNADNPEFTYETLKAYLMLHDPAHFDANTLRGWIGLDWQRNLPRDVSNEQRAALQAHLDTLLDAGAVVSPLPVDQALIRDVRLQLSQYSLPRRVYSRLKRQGVGSTYPAFSVARVAGPGAALAFVRASGAPLTEGVPGLYSFDAYHHAFLKQAASVSRQLADEEAWVLGQRSDTAAPGLSANQRLTEQVRRLYLDDYARVWEAFIADLKLRPSRNMQDSIQLARLLSAVDSPLPPLLRAMTRETTLATKRQAEKTLVDKASDKFGKTRADLEKLFGAAASPAAVAPVSGSLEAQLVDSRFESLHRLVEVPPGGAAPIDGVLQLLNEVFVLLNATETAVKSGSPPPPSDVPNKIKAKATEMPEPLRSMLQTLSQASAQQALGAIHNILSAGIGSEIGDFCRQAISGRYPFNRGSSRDVTQDDFARLFAPGGLFDTVFQKQLAPYVDTATRPWSLRSVNDVSMGASSALIQFQRAATIRDVFFRSGGNSLGLRLEFKPLEMDATINQFILDVDGQLVKYSHGPQVPQSVQWPGPRGSGQVRISIQPPTPSGTSGTSTQGPWALFRLFDRLSIGKTSQAERFRVVFDIGGRKTTFEVVASSVQNPFRLPELAQFQCPGGL